MGSWGLIFEMGKITISIIAQGAIADARGFNVRDPRLLVQSTIAPNRASKFMEESIADISSIFLPRWTTNICGGSTDMVCAKSSNPWTWVLLPIEEFLQARASNEGCIATTTHIPFWWFSWFSKRARAFDFFFFFLTNSSLGFKKWLKTPYSNQKQTNRSQLLEKLTESINEPHQYQSQCNVSQ